MAPPRFEVGETVECLAFDNKLGRWQRGEVVSVETKMVFRESVFMAYMHAFCCTLANTATCYLCKPLCPDARLHDVKYGDDPNNTRNLERAVPADRLRPFQPDPPYPISMIRDDEDETQSM